VLPLLLGFCCGFLSSIPPLGPGALLLLRRGLEGRTADGVAAATGGAVADASYCALAVVGFSYLFLKHPGLAASMKWVGVTILVLLGTWFLTNRLEAPRADGLPANGGNWSRQAVLGFSLAAFNPTLLITWSTGVAMIASLGVGVFSKPSRYAFPLGVALGDVAWALIALLLYRRLGSYLPHRMLRILMRSIGVMLLVIAGLFALGAIRS
jgi:threonine/homoserine/homoserine lactone efflux protein